MDLADSPQLLIGVDKTRPFAMKAHFQIRTNGRFRSGHLGCANHNHPYVVPIPFAYDDRTIYIYTTESKETDMIEANSEVRLQVEEVVEDENWTSVVVVGDAEKLTDSRDREKAFAAITDSNPALTPALSYRWVDRKDHHRSAGRFPLAILRLPSTYAPTVGSTVNPCGHRR